MLCQPPHNSLRGNLSTESCRKGIPNLMGCDAEPTTSQAQHGLHDGFVFSCCRFPPTGFTAARRRRLLESRHSLPNRALPRLFSILLTNQLANRRVGQRLDARAWRWIPVEERKRAVLLVHAVRLCVGHGSLKHFGSRQSHTRAHALSQAHKQTHGQRCKTIPLMQCMTQFIIRGSNLSAEKACRVALRQSLGCPPRNLIGARSFP